MKTLLLLALGILGGACLSRCQTSPFPASLDSLGTLGVPADNASTALTSGMLIGDTVAQVANGSVIPQWSLVTFGAELSQVCLVSGNTLTFGTSATCPSISGRGLSGTTAAAHALGVIGYLNINAYYLKAVNSALIALETKAHTDRVSVLDFGVPVTTATAQAALNSGAGIVYFPAGNYTGLGALTVPSGTSVLCAGKNVTTLTYAGSGTFISPAVAAFNQQLNVNDCGIVLSSGKAISLTGVWFSRVQGNRITGATVGISMDGTNYGVYRNKVSDNEFATTTTPVVCTGGGGQSCNLNTIEDNRATGFTTGVQCVASLCEYNWIKGNDFESPGASTARYFDIEGDNNTVANNTCDHTVTSGLTETCLYIRGAANLWENNKDSLAAGGGTVKFIDHVDSILYGAQNILEGSNGTTPVNELGDVVGGMALVLKSVLSGPSLRLKNMDSTGSGGACYQWGLNAYSTGYLYLQSLDCTLPIPNTNFNAIGWDTAGNMYPVKDVNMASGGVIRDSVYKNQSGTAANTDVVGLITLVAGAGGYSFTATYATAPVCVASDTSATPAAVQVATTTSALTLTVPGAASTHTYAYFCHGRT